MRKWRIEDSEELYNINGWGNSYFSINEKGHVQVTPNKKEGGSVDLSDLMRELYLRDVSSPVLIRFPEILDNRIEKISQSFAIASKEYEYKAQNYIVYPIKVNQMRQVVEEIVSSGKRFNIGLEAGSKPELHAVLAINTDNNSFIICNGYKDESYIELALLAQKMGKQVFIVVEKLNELDLTIEMAKRLKVKPNIGIRVKLASSGSGKWEESGGDASKFGLNSSELLEALEVLKKHHLSDCFRLIHFHIGSQITKIRRIKTALREAAQFYVQLHAMGFKIEFVDIGGGLGVDYDGTRSSFTENSINYSIQESEWSEEMDIQENDHELVKELYNIWDSLTQARMLEAWHDAQQIREESLDLFSLGMLDLKTRAQVEQLYFSIAREINTTINRAKHAPEELRQLSALLPDKYFCNFSLFQSLPDSWAIDQVFPIIPIHRLDEKPERTATLQDITCDSDGKIANFASQDGFRSSYLPVHSLKKNEPYYIGVFLVGAYQEILGDLHNLFGDTNVVHVSTNDSGYKIDQVIDGESVAEV
ncbi:MAG: Biosynthetic arginine decarboxylase, partial [Proteiniphilum sp. 51_7]